MKQKISLVTLMLLSVAWAVAVASLSANNITTGSLNETVEAIQHPFELVLKLNKTTYSLGETVNITISLTNISDENVKISLLAGGDPKSQFDFLIYDGSNDPIYRYSAHRGYYAGGPSVFLAPNQNITASYLWEQHDDDGGVVAEGKYFVVGRTHQIFYLDHSLSLETPRLEITIEKWTS
ncbi:MAG: BsuPI-related putative proteinase inhibitor [Candidatus Bathyarchaeota archaeon]|nr:BsuPI-related putative proteinase inhibitor [Candidatus Bathyarchaeota archaeon]MDH5779378.1 BsuPI-related putative proteinase inhibitor [Candidatus Bathyarchaeota archaeon]